MDEALLLNPTSQLSTIHAAAWIVAKLGDYSAGEWPRLLGVLRPVSGPAVLPSYGRGEDVHAPLLSCGCRSAYVPS